MLIPVVCEEIGFRPSRGAVESTDVHQQKQHRHYHKLRSPGLDEIVNKTSYSSAS